MKKIQFSIVILTICVSAMVSTNYAKAESWVKQFDIPTPNAKHTYQYTDKGGVTKDSTVDLVTTYVGSDGEFLYAATYVNEFVRKYSVSGELLEVFSIPGVKNFCNLTYDGEFFYTTSYRHCWEACDTIYKMNFKTKTLEGIIKVPYYSDKWHKMYSIAYAPDVDDGKGGFYVGCEYAPDSIDLIKKDGTFIKNVAVVPENCAAFSMAYDNISPGGPYLWLYSVDLLYTDMVIQIDLATGKPTGHVKSIPEVTNLKGRAMSGGGIVTNLIEGTSTLYGCGQQYNIWGIELTSTAPLAEEVGLKNLLVPANVEVGDPTDIIVSINNKGTDTLKKFEANYSINHGTTVTVVTDTIEAEIKLGETFELTFPTKWTPEAVDRYEVKVWLTNINDNENFKSDTLSATVESYDPNAPVVPRYVLMEYFTTALCVNCPPMYQRVSNWLLTRKDIIQICHHSGFNTDGLTVPENEELLVFYNGGEGAYWAPAMMLDRTNHPTLASKGPVFTIYENTALPLIDELRESGSFVSIDLKVKFDETTREITATVDGKFVSDMLENDYRLSLYLIEDSLTTTPPQAGNISGSEYIHRNVMRKALSETWGDTNVIIHPKRDSTFQKIYKYTLPENMNVDKSSLVAFVNVHNDDVNKRGILQSVKAPANGKTSIFEDENYDNFEILYWLENDFVRIESVPEILEISLYDLQGKIVKMQDGSDNILFTNNINSGVYIITVRTTAGISTKKLLVR